jgi:hypothetical protein
MKVEELQAIIRAGGGIFSHVFIGQTTHGMGVLVAFRAPNGELFTLPVLSVTEKNVGDLVRTIHGWRHFLYSLYKLLSEEKT